MTFPNRRVRQADARSPVVAEVGHVAGQRELRIGKGGDGRRELFAFPAKAD